MPLQSGSSRAAFEHNVKAEIEAGKPQRQAVAIAFSKKRGDATYTPYQRGSVGANATSQTTSRALHNDPALLKEFNALTKKFFGSPAKQGDYTDTDLRSRISRMKQELGQQDSLSSVALDALVGDGPEERIKGAWALYTRPGSPGEKQAAAEALRRMGVDPEKTAGSTSVKVLRRFRVERINGKYSIIVKGATSEEQAIRLAMMSYMAVTGKKIGAEEFRARALDALSSVALDALDDYGAVYAEGAMWYCSWNGSTYGPFLTRAQAMEKRMEQRVARDCVTSFEGQESTMRKYSGGDSLSAIARDALVNPKTSEEKRLWAEVQKARKELAAVDENKPGAMKKYDEASKKVETAEKAFERVYSKQKDSLADLVEQARGGIRGQTGDAWNNVKTDGRYRLLEGTGPNGGDWRVVGPRSFDATFSNRAEAEKQMLREADRRP